MLFQDQTILYDKEKGIKGNCLITCYASYLDFPVFYCPPIQLFYDVQKPYNFWMKILALWLEGYGLKEVAYEIQEEPVTWGHTDYYFAVGNSARGVQHIVIYKDGKMVHDPHPSKTGLLNIHEWITLEKINPE